MPGVASFTVLDCGDPDRVARRKTLYESYGFQSLASNPLRMFLPVSVIHKLIVEDDDGQQKDVVLTELALPVQNLDRG